MFSPRPQASTPTSQGHFVFRAGPAVSCETLWTESGGDWVAGAGGKLPDLLLREPIKDPARLQWTEVVKAAHYRIDTTNLVKEWLVENVA